MSKISCKAVELGVNWLDKDHAFPKEKLKSLTERLSGLLQLSGMDSKVRLFSNGCDFSLFN